MIRSNPHEPLRSPLPPARRFVGPALRWALIAALVLITLGALIALMVRVANGASLGDGAIAQGALIWFTALVPVLFLGRLFVLSRTFADRCFTWIGLSATFFGLAMLILFFGRLAHEGYRWFTVMPALIEERNQFLEERVARFEADLEKTMKAMREEMNDAIATAADEEEKTEIRRIFEKEEMPKKRLQMEETGREFKQERDAGVRPNTSPGALIWYFLTNGPTNQPQDAGILPALLGSLWVSLITILFAVPVGVGAALYLEEYRANNWLGRLIQININNLAGIPSVVYGILGGFVFFWIFSQLNALDERIAPRNVLGGGLTLGLLTLPVVIVAAQEAIRAVPVSIRHGAYALGATKWQTIWYQVLPLAWPGILTGTILALSRAIGEAAPLVLFGALLFVNQTPHLFSRFTVLPMQIFGWSDRPQEVWLYDAAMGCIVLMVTLLALNAVAIWLRNRAQKRMKW